MRWNYKLVSVLQWTFWVILHQLPYSLMHLIMVSIDTYSNLCFVSKSLNKSQLRWSVIQKEAYGIFYSCTYSQSLLRNRLFKIETDYSSKKRLTQWFYDGTWHWVNSLLNLNLSLDLTIISQMLRLAFVEITWLIILKSIQKNIFYLSSRSQTNQMLFSIQR